MFSYKKKKIRPKRFKGCATWCGHFNLPQEYPIIPEPSFRLVRTGEHVTRSLSCILRLLHARWQRPKNEIFHKQMFLSYYIHFYLFLFIANSIKYEFEKYDQNNISVFLSIYFIISLLIVNSEFFFKFIMIIYSFNLV